MHMDMLTAVVGMLGVISGFLFSLLRYTKGRDKDIHKEAIREATINVKLDNISNGVQSLQTDIKTEQKARVELSERVAKVEESTKQAHKRIDEIERAL